MNHALVHLKGVSKTYKTGYSKVTALQNVNLLINKGEFVSIMGSSGSGKSTLMHIIGCLDRPSEGTYHLNGLDVGNASRKQLALIRNRDLGFVFQSFNLLGRTTAIQNIELPMFYAIPRIQVVERRKKSAAALEQIDLSKRGNHYPNQLSGGQQQRVAIARAIVMNPGLVLADEPTGNLDSHTSIEIMAIFQRLHSIGMTIVLVTHEPNIACFASRSIGMRDGNIIEDKLQCSKNAKEIMDGSNDKLINYNI